jgi:hypothetical protein
MEQVDTYVGLRERFPAIYHDAIPDSVLRESRRCYYSGQWALVEINNQVVGAYCSNTLSDEFLDVREG